MYMSAFGVEDYRISKAEKKKDRKVLKYIGAGAAGTVVAPGIGTVGGPVLYHLHRTGKLKQWKADREKQAAEKRKHELALARAKG